MGPYEGHADTPPTKRTASGGRRGARACTGAASSSASLIFAVIAVVGLASGTIVAVSHNLPNIDAMPPASSARTR